ncbi:MAG: phosphodiester glycosidase family protein [Sphingomicrobium sp.]
MRTLFLIALACLAACGQEAEAPAFPKSACELHSFEGSNFTLCSERSGKIEIRSAAKDGTPFRSFAALETALGPRAKRVAFGMNAGMFDQEGRAIGLLIEDGKQLHPLNRRKGGGNFHLMPNGVFAVRRDGQAEVVTTDAFQLKPDIVFATQSGPMLVIDGKLHPRLDRDGTSHYVRNGVGIGPDGKPVFVISNDEVSFGKLARFFRDGLKVKNALYFDGSISSLWDPVNGRRDAGVPVGPMVVAFKAEASAPDPEVPAKP